MPEKFTGLCQLWELGRFVGDPFDENDEVKPGCHDRWVHVVAGVVFVEVGYFKDTSDYALFVYQVDGRRRRIALVVAYALDGFELGYFGNDGDALNRSAVLDGAITRDGECAEIVYGDEEVRDA